MGLLFEGDTTEDQPVQTDSQGKQVSLARLLMALLDLGSQVMRLVDQIAERQPCLAFTKLDILDVDQTVNQFGLMQGSQPS